MKKTTRPEIEYGSLDLSLGQNVPGSCPGPEVALSSTESRSSNWSGVLGGGKEGEREVIMGPDHTGYVDF